MNLRSHRIAAFGGLVLFALQPAPAARAGDTSPPTPDVSPLVVTATLTPTPLDQIGSSLTLITDKAIEDHQWRSLPDALAAVPGLSQFQTGGPGGLTSIFIRGANSNHTEVIIDGIDVNDPSQNGAFDFGQGVTADVARIEVLRGPESSLYGADALGGVINIVTRDGEGPPRLTASVEGGSFDTGNQTLGLSGSESFFHYAIDVAHNRAGDTPITPVDLLAPGEARIGDRYDNVTASAKLRFDITRNFSLGLVVRSVDATYRSTGENYDLYPDPNIPDAAQTDQWAHQFFARTEARLDLLNDKVQEVLGVAYTNYRTTIQSPDDGYGLPAPELDNGDRLRFDWLSTVVLSPRDTLVLGVDDDVERIIDSPVSAEESRVGGFAELQLRPLDGLTVAVSGRDDSDDRFGNKATWRIAPAYSIAATGTILKASYGTGFKAPTLAELFVNYPSFDFYANPDLKPETSDGYDVGFEQPLLAGRARLGATWFHNAIRDLIDDNADYTSYANIGRATTYGVESFASIAVSGRLEARADYTWTIARDDILQQELLRRPKNKASLGLNWKATRKLTLSSELLYVGAWVDGNRDFSIPRMMASPYGTLNVAGAYDLGHGVTAFARIDNLLDRHYESPVGFDKPGIGAFGGLRLALGGKP